MAKKKRKTDSQGRGVLNIKIDAVLLDEFQLLAKQHSIDTGEVHSATSLAVGLIRLAVSKPIVLNMITTEGENNVLQ